jgi:hypothetical protein
MHGMRVCSPSISVTKATNAPQALAAARASASKTRPSGASTTTGAQRASTAAFVVESGTGRDIGIALGSDVRALAKGQRTSAHRQKIDDL